MIEIRNRGTDHNRRTREDPMRSEASFGPTFHADRAFSGLWDTMPDLTPNSEREDGREPLEETDEAFRALFDNRIVGVAITSPGKRWLRVNDRWCEMIGYSREELALLDWSDLTHPDDIAADVAQFKRLVSGETRDYTLKKRFIRKDGEIVYTEIYVSAVWGADSAFKYELAMAIDITQRNQAEQSLTDIREKLIEAQEQERVRIGRELHDDIGQRLALVALDVDLIRENPSTIPRELRRLRSQINEILMDIQCLSNDLHAANLEYLGALEGIKSWCKEFGARYNLQVGFSSDVRTLLPGAVGIGLFRVVQEALQNVVKHSGADRAEVSFQEWAGEVFLLIRDSGRGFSTREVRDGFGIMSIRERIRLLDGTVTIESVRMRGTSVVVRVPLHRNYLGKSVAGPIQE